MVTAAFFVVRRVEVVGAVALRAAADDVVLAGWTLPASGRAVPDVAALFLAAGRPAAVLGTAAFLVGSEARVVLFPATVLAGDLAGAEVAAAFVEVLFFAGFFFVFFVAGLFVVFFVAGLVVVFLVVLFFAAGACFCSCSDPPVTTPAARFRTDDTIERGRPTETASVERSDR